jgi:hypothetical protein
MAGEDNVAQPLRLRPQLGRRVRPVQGDPSLVGKSPRARGRSGIRLVSVEGKVACAVHPASEPQAPVVVAIQVAWSSGSTD